MLQQCYGLFVSVSSYLMSVISVKKRLFIFCSDGVKEATEIKTENIYSFLFVKKYIST